MTLPVFKIEEFWKKYEFSARYLLCPSDAESWWLSEILDLADSESKKLWDTLQLGYTEVPGHPLLREEIARLYSNVTADQVFTFAGAEEGIYCSIRALLSPGDHVIVVKPCYQSLEAIASSIGADITYIDLDPQNDWKLMAEQLTNAFRSDTRLLILNNPHNPTGSLIEQDVHDVMIALARKCGAYIFMDEVYRYLEMDESKRLPSIADAYEKGISLNVMTKAFGAAGLRIGWIASRDQDLLQKVSAYKLYTSICNSAPSEILAIIALRAKEKILQRNRQIILSNLNILDQFFKRQQNRLSWVRPQGGTMGFPKLLLPVSIDQFYLELLEKTGILIMPASALEYKGNHFRIGFGRTSMPEILEKFEHFLETSC